MSIEGQPGPFPPVYNGFSAPVSRLRRGANSRPGKILLGGTAAAALIGVAFGLLAKPDVRDEDGMLLDKDQVVQIEVGPGRAPVVPGAPANATPLQTLPPGVSAPNVVVVAAGPRAPAAPRSLRAPPAAADCGDAPCESEYLPADDTALEPPPIRLRSRDLPPPPPVVEPDADIGIPPPDLDAEG